MLETDFQVPNPNLIADEYETFCKNRRPEYYRRRRRLNGLGPSSPDEYVRDPYDKWLEQKRTHMLFADDLELEHEDDVD